MSVLGAANAARMDAAARRDVQLARESIADDLVMRKLPDRYRRALYIRASHPELSLRDLGRLLGLTKDQFSARLRRGLVAAGKSR